MRTLPVVWLLALIASADTVYVKGKRIHGRVVSEDPEVIVNPYNSSLPEMVFGVERFPASSVKKIVRTLPLPPHAFERDLLAASTAEECLKLAEWCKTKKLKVQRIVALEKALALDAENVAARKLLGSKAPAKNRSEQLALARSILDAPDAASAEALLAQANKDRSFPFSGLYLRRARRSKAMRRGYLEDRPVTLRADKLEGNARYTLFVPEKYDPLMPAPLVVGLHGGGRGGADGKLVVGFGSQAMPFYQQQCAKRGWICVCPTALRAGWGGPLNDGLIDAILEELQALYNIDVNRIYLVGHSMGGGGTWVQGTRIPETWAAIAPASSYGVRGIDKLDKTKTGFYVYHSDNDPRTGIGRVRPRMKGLPGSGIDFVYTELPGRGHSFPAEVREDIFNFFSMRSRAAAPRFKPTVRRESSFARKASRDEKKYLPLKTADSAAAASLRPLLAGLRKGGGVAERVVVPLSEHPDPKVSARVAKILLDSKSTPDVRRYAAQVLGERKARDQIKAIGRALLIENDAAALLSMLDALQSIGDAAASPHLVRFLEKRREYFDKRLVGDRIHWSDWITILPPMSRACDLLRADKEPKAAAAISGDVIEGILLGAYTVLYDREMHNPVPAVRRLASSACAALTDLGDSSVVATLKRAREKSQWAADPAIAAHLDGAIEALKD